MIFLPLVGWFLVSASSFKVPTVLFETISWPHLPVPTAMKSDGVTAIAEFLHSKGAWVLLALLAVHVAGAVKHQITAEEGVLKRMIPAAVFGKTTRPRKPAQGYLAAIVPALLLFGAIAVLPQASRNLMMGSQPPASGLAPAAEPATETNWEVDYNQSELRFTGIYNGAEFTGIFKDWSADVAFYPEDLEKSDVRVTVRTASADAGKKLYNDSLMGQEWFDISTFPEARISLADFRTSEDGYTANARIQIKTSSVTAPLTFTLDIENNEATLLGTAILSRKALNLGQDSDPSGTWVDDNITVTVSGKATRK